MCLHYKIEIGYDKYLLADQIACSVALRPSANGPIIQAKRGRKLRILIPSYAILEIRFQYRARFEFVLAGLVNNLINAPHRVTTAESSHLNPSR